MVGTTRRPKKVGMRPIITHRVLPSAHKKAATRVSMGGNGATGAQSLDFIANCNPTTNIDADDVGRGYDGDAGQCPRRHLPTSRLAALPPHGERTKRQPLCP